MSSGSLFWYCLAMNDFVHVHCCCLCLSGVGAVDNYSQCHVSGNWPSNDKLYFMHCKWRSKSSLCKWIFPDQHLVLLLLKFNLIMPSSHKFNHRVVVLLLRSSSTRCSFSLCYKICNAELQFLMLHLLLHFRTTFPLSLHWILLLYSLQQVSNGDPPTHL